MKAAHGINLNSIQDGYGIGALASIRQAEIRQDSRAVSTQVPSRFAGTPRFTPQAAISLASAVAVTVAAVALHWLG